MNTNMTDTTTFHEGTALAYAWGREDSGTVKTAGTIHDFAAAYTAMWDDFEANRRFTTIPVQRAYDNWQDSGGTCIHASLIYSSIPDRVMGAGLVRGASVTDCKTCGKRLSYVPRPEAIAYLENLAP